MSAFVVVGAAGIVGSEVADALVGRGSRGVAPVRDQSRRVPDGVRPIVADANDLTAMAGALEGMDKMFLLPGLRGTSELLRMALECDVARVVLLSSASVEHSGNEDALTTFHRRSERAVQASGFSWTILSPPGLRQQRAALERPNAHRRRCTAPLSRPPRGVR